MAKLTRAEFEAQIADLLASAKDPKISAADARTIVLNLLDTLAFATLENAGEGLSFHSANRIPYPHKRPEHTDSW